ncbi:Glucose_6-phosphate N-acetyltransferase [Hexamita inflata]|uniref:Glucosamine 6-phosphate N-acetyltransferase n=1 Tax=Hexamita inflata TaxID=28002 RepID=A0AA86UUI7_9EUKA|nr:Glucose 6-phosphate N-acetyltransferase [Hexamita inflata]
MAIVREAQLEDLIYLPPILAQLTSVGNVDQQQLTAFYDEIKTNKNHIIYVVELNETIIGCATLLIEPKIIHQCSKAGHIEDVVIDKQYRKRGYGKQLITHLLHEGEKRGCYKIILDSESDVSNFYAKCGMGPKQQCMALYFNKK